MTLRQLLARLPAERLLLSSPAGAWRVADLLAADVAGAGRHVALQLSDAGACLAALTALDGQAETLTLLPATLAPEHLPALLAQAACDTLVNDAGIQVLAPPPEGTPGASTGWRLATSGTTGLPKLVSHTLASLLRSTKLAAADGPVPRWGLLYDHARFAGLQVLLQATLSGAHLTVPSVQAPLRDKLATLIAAGCTHLSATPTLWRQIAMRPEAARLPLRQLTLGGEIADQRLLDVLAALYPGARIVHIYASTEAGVGFSVKDGQAGFPARYLSEPPAGVALRLQGGRLFLRNTEVLGHYVGSAPEQAGFGDAEGWIDSGDQVEQRGERLVFLGRASGLINVGGDKVYPEEIETLLLAHPTVRAARVFGRPSSILGTVVAAELVLTEPVADLAALRRELKAWLGAHVAANKVPAVIQVVDDLVANASGKLTRTP